MGVGRAYSSLLVTSFGKDERGDDLKDSLKDSLKDYLKDYLKSLAADEVKTR